LEVIIGTNGSINKAAEIIAAAPDEILFALDGVTAETYHKYRNFPGVTFAQVLHNLRDLAEEKKKQKNSFTKIILQFVVMKANEHEIEDILKLAKNFALDGVDYKPVSLMAAESLDKNSAIAEFLPNHAIKQYQKTKTNVKVLQAGYCSFAFSTAVILHNGELSSCCYDFDGQQTFGNVFANGFAYAWMSDKAREYRKFIFWKKLRLCQNCGNTYKTVKRVLIK
jgi:MoaA/NifB/PqqE/SkfB family radical SAM enzyme